MLQPKNQLATNVPHAVIDAVEIPYLVDRFLDGIRDAIQRHVLFRDVTAIEQIFLDEGLPPLPLRAAGFID